ISVARMEFLEDLNKNSFLDRYYLDHELTAEEAFQALRKKFRIDESLSDWDARRIMIVRNALEAQGYMAYLPVDVAQDVSDQSIIDIEEAGDLLANVDIISKPVRYYPYGTTASHILGYLGRISESEKEAYLAEGYSVNDLVGKEGIEKAYEDVLRGTDGTRQVMVNAYGELVQVLSETAPEKGQDIYLTIDIELQQTAEAALEEALSKIRVGGSFESKWGNYKYSTAYKNANVGAAVALDTDTGEVLAMASLPGFDPNLFATGITTENWNSLQSENPRDPLAPLPLYNVASRTAVQPGSTFKMVTATAAMAKGLDPGLLIRDGGAVALGNRTYGCLVWNRYRGTHGRIDLYKALEVSCNYYFYSIGSGWDWADNKSLGLDDMGIDDISYYAEQYGLGLPTGIEIRETVVPTPNEESKLANTKRALRNVLMGRAELYFTEKTVIDKTLLEEYIETIVGWTAENPSRGQIISRLADVGVREEMIETVADLCKYSYFNQAAWTTGDEFNISIGQGENAYTPLQMANYIATIGNGGTLNKVSLIHAIEGEGVVEKEAGTPIDLENTDILDDILEGMRRVAHGEGGSARSMFAKFPVNVAAKTGTAERGGRINPPDEVEYIKEYLPKINSSLEWEDVEEEMYRLLREYPDTYSSQNSAVRQAVINVSGRRTTTADIDAFKDEYDEFAWFVATAPVEDPKISVCVLLVQGGSGPYSGPVAREIIGEYLQLDGEYEDYSLTPEMSE
ncbi:MAG: penicillin-binding protein, partial [Firmicutes bacterium]|nr:penicillin-binding protein [Bacillota bacterium]